MQIVSFSELKTTSEPYLGKAYRLDESGQLVSLPPKTLYKGTGETKSIDFQDLPDYLNNLNSRCMLVSGIARQNQYKITTKELLSASDSSTIARSNQFFNWNEQDAGLVFLDCDKEDMTPRESLEFLKKCIEIATGGNVKDFAFIAKSSSSAHIYDAETNDLLTNSTKHHIIIPALNMRLLSKFLKYLDVQAWAEGYGWIKISEGASMLPRGVYDVALGSPSQPIFAAPPYIIGNGLVRKPPKIYYQAGSMLDLSLFQIDPHIRKKAENAITQAKNSSEVRKALEAKREEVIKRIVEKQEVSESKAERILDARIYGELSIDDKLHFDDGEIVEVKSVLADPERYDNRSLHDPLEHNAGSCKAMFFSNNDNPIIHSFLHGGRIFKFDSVSFAYLTANDMINDIDENDDAYEIIFSENMMKHLSTLKGKDPAKYRKISDKAKGLKVGKVDLKNAVKDYDKENMTNKSTDKLKAIVEKQFELFHDPQGNPYAKDITEYGQQIFTVDSKAKNFRHVVNHIAQKKLKWTVSPASVSTVIENIAAIAVREGNEEEVYNRCAYFNSAVYLNMADNTGRAIKIDADGWEIIAHPPVNFITTPSMKPFPNPVKGKGLDDMFKFFPVEEEEQYFILVWMLHSFFQGKPQPLLELSGVPGSGKTTLAKIIRKLIDPTVEEVSTLPDRHDAFAPLFKKHHVVIFDNVRAISDFVSDQLCVRATGGYATSRELYTDSDVHAIDISGSTIITSISSPILNSDLKDRTVSINLKQFIKDKTGRERMTEEKLMALFDAVHGKIFGVMLDLMVEVMRRLPEISNENLPRMADFCKTGAAVCLCLGKDIDYFHIQYNMMQSMQNSQILIGDKTCVKMLYLLRENPTRWENGILASDLLDELQRVRLKTKTGYDPLSDVTNVRNLVSMLRKKTPSFDAVGIEIFHDKQKEHGKVLYHIKLRTENELEMITKNIEIYKEIDYVIEMFKPFIHEECTNRMFAPFVN